ncbi:MAG: hypothetical protein ACLGIV_07375 [Actinomycetes bacterium]
MSQTPPDEPTGEPRDDREDQAAPEPPPSWPAAPPPAADYPYAPQPWSQPEPPAAASPYGPPAGPYGQPAAPQPPQPPPYGTGGYPPAGPPPGYTGGPGYGYTGGPGHGGYTPSAPPAPTPTSTIVLLVISGLATLSCYFSLAGVPALVMSIIAMTKSRTEPESARRLTRTGWITFTVIAAVTVVLMVLGIAALFAFDSYGY